MLPTAVFSGFIFAALAPFLARIFKQSVGWVVAILPFSLSVYFALQIPKLSGHSSLGATLPWAAEMGVPLSFSLDGLSVLFALLITSIGTLVMVYAGAYLRGRPDIGKFYALLFMFMASMLGIVLSDNLVVLFVFWELTGLSSFLLIGFEHDREKARTAALQALLVTSMGGLAMLAGFLVLGAELGTYEISSLAESGEMFRESDVYLPALILILLGAFTKSAQFPFHFWLPNAMNAPTPVSTYLHSATMVKAGIYLLARFSPVLSGTDAWFYIVSGTGMATILIGSVLTLGQTDMKLLLAYMTVVSLGTLTMLFGIGGPLAAKAAVVFLIVHSLYKGALFMIAGAIEHRTGIRDITKLGSLKKVMPVLAMTTLMAGLSLAGLPPFLGFVGKELVYKAALDETGVFAMAFIMVAMTAKVTATIVAGIVVVRPFFRAQGSSPGLDLREVREPSREMLLGPMVLALAGLVLGLWPGLLSHSVLGPAVGAVTEVGVSSDLHSWPEASIALAVSILSITMGLAGYLNWDRLRPRFAFLEASLASFGPAAAYERGLVGILRISRLQTEILQGGSLRRYLAIIFGVVMASTGLMLFRRPSSGVFRDWFSIPYYEWAIAGFILVGSVFAGSTRSLLAAFLALGIVGYNIALIYVLYGAPDLALTQIVVETLTIVIATLIIGRIPDFSSVTETGLSRVRDAVVASGFGLTIMGLLCLALEVPLDPYLSEYFSEKSVPEAQGRNIVNVILVDFRAVDTLGEITVITVAALGVFALLKLGKAERTSE